MFNKKKKPARIASKPSKKKKGLETQKTQPPNWMGLEVLEEKLGSADDSGDDFTQMSVPLPFLDEDPYAEVQQDPPEVNDDFDDDDFEDGYTELSPPPIQVETDPPAKKTGLETKAGPNEAAQNALTQDEQGKELPAPPELGQGDEKKKKKVRIATKPSKKKRLETRSGRNKRTRGSSDWMALQALKEKLKTTPLELDDEEDDDRTRMSVPLELFLAKGKLLEEQSKQKSKQKDPYKDTLDDRQMLTSQLLGPSEKDAHPGPSEEFASEDALLDPDEEERYDGPTQMAPIPKAASPEEDSQEGLPWAPGHEAHPSQDSLEIVFPFQEEAQLAQDPEDPQEDLKTPVYTEETVPPTPRLTPTPASAPEGSPEAELHKVLIVDDDPISQKVLDTLLRRAGYEAEICANAEDAIAALQAPHPPRIILLDWYMPEVDGLTLTKELQQTYKDELLYIIFVTANEQEDDLLEALLAGANDYIQKPLSYRTLQAKLVVAQRTLALQKRLLRHQQRTHAQNIISATVQFTGPLAILSGLQDLELPNIPALAPLQEELHDMQHAVEQIEEILQKMRSFVPADPHDT